MKLKIGNRKLTKSSSKRSLVSMHFEPVGYPREKSEIQMTNY